MTPQEDAVLVNPNYGTSKEYEINCVSCVIAYEMRRRGFDVEASPLLRKTDELQKKPWELFGREPVPCTFATVAEQMLAWGDGARAAIAITVDDNVMRGAHIYVAERYDGRTYFIDPQCPNKNASMFLSHAKTAFFWNIDKAKLTGNAADAFDFRPNAVPPKGSKGKSDWNISDRTEEINAAVMAYQSGNKQALVDLIAIMTPLLKVLAVKFTKKYAPEPGFGDSADALQIMYENLILLAQRYDPSKGASFLTYSQRRLVGSMHDARFVNRSGAKNDAKEFDPSNDIHYHTSETPTDFLDSMLNRCYNPDHAEVIVRKMNINNAIKRLKPNEQKVVKMMYVLNMNGVEMSRAIGVSEAAICQTKNKAMKKLSQMDDIKALVG